MEISTVERVIIEHGYDILEMSKEAANRFFQLQAMKRYEQNAASRQTLETRELLEPISPVVE